MSRFFHNKVKKITENPKKKTRIFHLEARSGCKSYYPFTYFDFADIKAIFKLEHILCTQIFYQLLLYGTKRQGKAA
jgi:hypothetical protein